VSEYLGIDVDVSILEANDFLMAQIGVLMKTLEDNDMKLKLKDEQRRELAELGARLDPARGAPAGLFFYMAPWPSWLAVSLRSQRSIDAPLRFGMCSERPGLNHRH
jgi:hypothetical protein